MNERIKELAEQATLYANDIQDADAYADWYEVRDTKFAELVRQDEREQAAQSDKLLIDLIQEQRAEIDRLRSEQLKEKNT